MPNWVFNTLTIQDSNPETVNLIKEQLNRPFERRYLHNWNVQTQQFEPKTVVYNNPVFSFWNIIAPTADIMSEYEGQTPKTKAGLDDIEAWNKEIQEISRVSNDWYSWNTRNWGTKWDVAVSDEDQYPDTELLEFMTEGEDHWLVYRFNTAWAPPLTALIKLSNQYPTAVLTLDWQEEQGFGGQIELVDGDITSESNYDSQCRDCDEYDCLEYCDECATDICNQCHYMGEADLEGAKECQTHKIYLDEEHVPDYRMEQIK